MSALSRLEAKYVVDQSTGCWLWTAAVFRNGYGQFYLDGRNRLAHRAAYELLVGQVPVGLDLDHLCRVRSCVNPAHLEPVTRSVNLRRGETGKTGHVRPTHCKRGHDLVLARTDPKTGWRYCRTCGAAAQRECRARRVA